ncbi:hypothetical protein JTE90_022516 [Oedothorax gibbosus]|uniref:Uncharacterized protein n=1 Tax=Oedothorax gibbosus TaxID=931172 RepID=A0AAV6V133_9ARAC|nr:hypothetical protein JTE90_022516 [Oedothorax gibbosus]
MSLKIEKKFMITLDKSLSSQPTQPMGKLLYLNNPNSDSTMNINPRPTSWNSLCPTFIDARRAKLLQDESSKPIIGSPPPAGPPKVMWNEPPDMPKGKTDKATMTIDDESDLASRVQGIHLQPPPQQPMIICETIPDVPANTFPVPSTSSESFLSVPEVDISKEKMRPPY